MIQNAQKVFNFNVDIVKRFTWLLFRFIVLYGTIIGICSLKQSLLWNWVCLYQTQLRVKAFASLEVANAFPVRQKMALRIKTSIPI